ncbi:hypothetical protein PF619_gp25 [Salmonella phage GRNsp27]|uniref:Uncharacterized protein n=1 Tax=Salmonella phage GRNsp27 TaxID=2959429 RepID=A0A9E7N135_9CAUD|nr:hypothetical protein PF619_gp25 [Salmonella phage GRNsp27]USW07559.1 hypothetical protein [Salmonella phage GRNsp27]
MFKKGQLIRSKLTGHYFRVLGDNLKRPLVEAVRSGAIGNINPSHVALIGNNYQAKPKCSR